MNAGTATGAAAGKLLGSDGTLRQSTPLLVRAVAFCDIGTSVYVDRASVSVSTMIALRSANPARIAEAIAREKGRDGRTLFALHVEERAGLFVRDWTWEPRAEGVDVLRARRRLPRARGWP